jgi:phosphoenolpyruvate synthase/pyruvate phosphate dikinase
LTSAVSASALQLGGKGANLCEMAKCGVNVPPGLTITTEVCQEFYRVGECPSYLVVAVATSHMQAYFKWAANSCQHIGLVLL